MARAIVAQGSECRQLGTGRAASASARQLIKEKTCFEFRAGERSAASAAGGPAFPPPPPGQGTRGEEARVEQGREVCGLTSWGGSWACRRRR